jgi:hypothetical protein
MSLAISYTASGLSTYAPSRRHDATHVVDWSNRILDSMDTIYGYIRMHILQAYSDVLEQTAPVVRVKGQVKYDSQQR